MNTTYLLGMIGLAGAVLCIGAYIWGFIYKVVGFRPLAVLALFSTVVALAELSIMLTHEGSILNAEYAMVFLVISGLAQALAAVRIRPGRDSVRTREDDA